MLSDWDTVLFYAFFIVERLFPFHSDLGKCGCTEIAGRIFDGFQNHLYRADWDGWVHREVLQTGGNFQRYSGLCYSESIV